MMVWKRQLPLKIAIVDIYVRILECIYSDVVPLLPRTWCIFVEICSLNMLRLNVNILKIPEAFERISLSSIVRALQFGNPPGG